MDRITILGMGPLGVTIGIGLKKAGINGTEIVGTDGDSRALKKALQMGALDNMNRNLKDAIKGASLVIIDTPHSETREFLEAIGPILDENSTVTDTGSSKSQTLGWVKQYLPANVNYVGGRPLPTQVMLTLEDVVPGSLEGTNYCVMPDSSASPESVRTVSGMVEVLGAKPVFMSPEEHDSYAAATAHVPIILSGALVTVLSKSPGWRDIAKVVGPEFNALTKLGELDPEDNSVAFSGNTEAIIHWLDQIIGELNTYRDQIQMDNHEIMDTLIIAWEQLTRLRSGDSMEDPENLGPPGPTMSRSIGQMFVGKHIADRAKQLTDINKKAPWRYPRRKRP